MNFFHANTHKVHIYKYTNIYTVIIIEINFLEMFFLSGLSRR